ncbi:MAG: myo-inositol-1(or 4)-monophosphatase, partial [bacterium]
MSSSAAELQARHDAAQSIVATAAEHALELFREGDLLDIEVKGLQDWVSNADKSVEDLIRAALGELFPNDGIIGEEHANKQGSSAFTWVIDPIDGTTNFVNSTPGWCVVLACVEDDQTVIAAICDPIS